MGECYKQRGASALQVVLIVALRVAVGWHFLYEGVSKLQTTGWTAEPYLLSSRWIFSGLFQWMASDAQILRAVDLLNIWGAIAVGLGLMLGCFARAASVAGAVMILLYYAANPPVIGNDFGVAREGSYLIVDKNLVELLALCVLAVSGSSREYGIDRFISLVISRIRSRGKIAETADAGNKEGRPEGALVKMELQALGRRDMIRSVATAPFLGAFAFTVIRKRKWESHEEKGLVDAVSRATIRTFNFTSLKDLKGQMPKSRIGNVEFSRLILGGNLIGGWAHARDLIYVSKLVKAYHHRDKVFETFLLAEKCGVNAILTNPILCEVINEYWKRDIGRIKFISDCGGADVLEKAQMSADRGAAACYIQGETADNLARFKQFDLMNRTLELIRKNGLPAGLGAHRLETVKACVENGLKPDFWMKTLHHTRYWSARAKQEYDNIFCREPDETIKFMQDVKVPWIAFKTLAAGAITPEQGFKYAFENGADFICVGMYDFQLVEDVNIALDVLGGEMKRNRPWMA
ncbi:MAG TPA: DoxX family protein [Candidatus Brocadiia bacterium]|nr:DoxX family protein [Candidatus Brocadiia bacterium]